LQADGWYLRQDIIWHKPNPMPESVTDRCTKAHEYIFLLSKSARYYYDNEAVKEPVKPEYVEHYQKYASLPTVEAKTNPNRNDGGTHTTQCGFAKQGTTTRNRRSVWTVATQPYSGAHFATFPPKLIEPCILAGCPERVCAECGKAWERVVERGAPYEPENWGKNRQSANTVNNDSERRSNMNGALHAKWKASHPDVHLGFRPTCTCNAGTILGTVLDPFGGSGTTAAVALAYGRNAILCELNPEYGELIHERVGAVLTEVRNAAGEIILTARERATGQMGLFGGDV
jgi:hypothetical protein